MDKKAQRADKIEARRAKVLDLHSKGYTVRSIGESLKVSKSTVHDDIVILRQEATEKIADFVESLPFVWTRAVCSTDLRIKRANDLLERKGLEVDQELSAIKVLCDMNDKRLALFSSPEILKRSVDHVQKLKARLEQLKKDQGSPWEFVVDIQN